MVDVGAVPTQVRNWWLGELSHDPDRLWKVPVTLRADKGIVLTAVRQSGGTLQYASESLRGDSEVVSAAVSNSGTALEHANELLRGDREIVMAAVKTHAQALQYASEALSGDRDIVMAAVRQKALGYAALEYASDVLRGDRGIVLAAVEVNGIALEWASATLRGDREIVMSAVASNGAALERASLSLRGDKEIAMAAVSSRSNSCFAFNSAAEALRCDPELVAALWSKDPEAIALRVTMLSGQSCTVAVSGSSNLNLLSPVLSAIAKDLSLDYTALWTRGELLSVKTLMPVPDDAALRRLGSGEVHELQLVVQAA